MEKMDEITRRLASQQPLLSDADALTESILANLPAQISPQESPILRAVRWISSVAAVGLLILFYSQSHAFVQRPEDVDYGQSLQPFQSDYSPTLDNLPPREALRQFVEMKRSRTNFSDIKRTITL
jgi:hypothetical protein